MLALEYCLQSTIAYRMQFCVWSIDTYDELDRIYTKIVRKITRNMHGYPSKPIWALAVDGGLGIQSLLDYVHKCKLRLLLRNIDKNDSTGKAFEGLVSRALRSAGTGGLRWRGQSIRSSLGAPVWLSSLVAWLSRMGIEIRVQGPPSMNPASELIDGSIEERINLANRGIALIGENSDNQEPASLQLRVGQCWGPAGACVPDWGACRCVACPAGSHPSAPGWPGDRFGLGGARSPTAGATARVSLSPRQSLAPSPGPLRWLGPAGARPALAATAWAGRLVPAQPTTRQR